MAAAGGISLLIISSLIGALADFFSSLLEDAMVYLSKEQQKAREGWGWVEGAGLLTQTEVSHVPTRIKIFIAQRCKKKMTS